MMRAALVAIAVALAPGAACGPGAKGGPNMNNKLSTETLAPAASSVVSTAILAREPVANTAQVKHILIGWKDLEENYQGHLDERAAKRTKADAEVEVKSLLKQLAAGADFDVLMKAKSEDTGSAASARAFTVTPDAQLVIEFRQLSLRLNIGELGVCQSDYGFHIIKRIE
jgi:hypothetical protein